jgi:hypothetical protein
LSSLAIRNAIQDKLELDFTQPVIGILSEAIDNNNLPDQWFALDFITTDNQPLGLGRNTCWREISAVTVYCSIKSGSGVDVALQLAEDVANAFRYYSDGEVKVRQVGAPESPDTSDGRWVLCSVILDVYRDYIA